MLVFDKLRKTIDQVYPYGIKLRTVTQIDGRLFLELADITSTIKNSSLSGRVLYFVRRPD